MYRFSGNRKIRNANKVVVHEDGERIVFDSKLEYYFYNTAKMLNIEIELKPKFVLQEAFTDNQGNNIRAITYTADFRVGDDIIDVKGYPNDVFPLKRKLFAYKYMREGSPIRFFVLKNKKEINKYLYERTDNRNNQ